jgi:hypothetical protein
VTPAQIRGLFRPLPQLSHNDPWASLAELDVLAD